jgi:hypothetical protein
MTVNDTTPRVQHVTNGVQDTFSFTFRVLEEDDVEVFLDDNTTPESAATYTVNLSVGPPVGQNGGDVVMDSPPATGTLTIQRRTDQTQETDYVPFDAFPAESHETALDKTMMVAQENRDIQDRVFFAVPGYDPSTELTIPDYESGKLLQWSVDPDDGLPHRLINSTMDLTGLQQAVDDAEAAAAAAAASAADAQNSADAAAISETNAANSEANAATSESNAATSETNAANSESNAATSETNAANSASAALTSENNAATSETNAANSAAAALSSENNAATSETNAANSAAAALTSENNAATSETNAANSESNAATSETNAAASAAAAAVSAAQAAFFDVSTFDPTPSATGIIRHIMTRSATYDFDGTAGTGFAGTAPTAGTVFTVNKELLAGGTTALGTMTFPLGVNDGVWADLAGGDVTFAAGDRIEVVAPGAVNSIADVAITVPLLLP